MTLYESVGNMHMHTPYSDGMGSHAEIAKAALAAGLDFIVVTDHNMLVEGVEGYYGSPEEGHVLLMTGEEVHDRTRLPQVNHLLVYNARREMASFAQTPQGLIDEVEAAGGLSFLAHPRDEMIRWLPPDGDGIAIPWVDWQVKGYHGLEIWNCLADWKETMPTVRQGFQSIFRPERWIIGPRRTTLDCWDSLLAEGQRVVGIGGADAHAAVLHFGPYKHTLFPYDFIFCCVNTHILTPTPLAGDIEFDRALLFEALRAGRAYIGYDLPGSTRGFRFSAQGMDGAAEMGDSLRVKSGVTLQVLAPQRAHIKMIRHGEVVGENEFNDALVCTAREPGAYRVEVWKEFHGKPRCWILSNPIYITP